MCEPSEVAHMRSIRAKAIARRVKLLIVIVIFYLSLGLLKAEKGAFILKKKVAGKRNNKETFSLQQIIRREPTVYLLPHPNLEVVLLKGINN